MSSECIDLPKSEKALLALMIFSSTDCIADRLYFHHVPRYLPSVTISILEENRDKIVLWMAIGDLKNLCFQFQMFFRDKLVDNVGLLYNRTL